MSAKDLSMVPAVRYGIACEWHALQRYQGILRNTGRCIHLRSAGLFIDPAQPWLGASQDAIVYDTSEELPWGCMEVNCPYSLRDADGEMLLLSSNTCVSFDNMKRPQLKTDYPYFAQVVGQMALTGLQWADFVLCDENFIVVQRLRFAEQVWREMKAKLDAFYFDTLLLYLAGKDQQVTVVLLVDGLI